MTRFASFFASVIVCLGAWLPPAHAQQSFRRLPLREYRDKMLAGWIGQMVAVTWALPMEFRYNGEIVPESMVPKWEPAEVNDALSNDDIFNDAALLYLIDKGGLDVSSRRAVIERSLVWAPNSRLLTGVAPPDLYATGGRVGAGSLGYQISADITGLVAPGLPNIAISLGERLTNPYGDGLYAGQFVGAMYSEAFFESSPARIVDAALRAIPGDCGYAQMVRDVVSWRQQNPKDWQRTWQLIQDKYRPAQAGRAAGGSRSASLETWVMDVKLNGAYIVMGLLYGDGDLDKTIVTAMRAGDDADCNPSNAAGVLFTTVGYAKLPERFRYKIDEQTLIHYAYGRQKGVHTFPQVLELTEKVARQAVVKAGGRIEKTAAGEEVLVIPVEQPKPSRLYRAGDTITLENSRLTKEELAQVRGVGALAETEFKKWAPGWELGGGCELGLRPEIFRKENVFVTYPPDKNTACTLSRSLTIPGGGVSTILEAVVSHASDGAWTLVVKVDGKEVFLKHVVKQRPWMHAKVDLTPYAGKTVKLELIDQPHRFWNYPWAYWGQILIDSSATTGAPQRLGFWANTRGDFREQ